MNQKNNRLIYNYSVAALIAAGLIGVSTNNVSADTVNNNQPQTTIQQNSTTNQNIEYTTEKNNLNSMGSTNNKVAVTDQTTKTPKVETSNVETSNVESNIEENQISNSQVKSSSNQVQDITDVKVDNPETGTISKNEDGSLTANSVDKGDSYAFSDETGNDFVYTADVHFNQKQGAASLVFRANKSTDPIDGYIANIEAATHIAKMWRMVNGTGYELLAPTSFKADENGNYTLKVIAYGKNIEYYINDILVGSAGDYVVQKDDRGQPAYKRQGYFGLLTWNGDVTYKNIRYQNLTDKFNPLLKDITVTSNSGNVEDKEQFFSDGTNYIQYVDNKTKTVDFKVVANNPNAKVVAYDLEGNEYTDLKNIPVSVGANYITIVSEIPASDGTTIKATYHVNVHRRQKADVYYKEKYRDQYHYSVKDGWGNDPNGLIYYNGLYHFFYQFYDDVAWGPMHWGHATSKDLIHWNEEPIAFYPDANGAAFSGSIVADTGNTSGLFSGKNGGLVAFITADGGGQRIKLAYSSDEGKTWTKLDDPVLDYSTDDPLKNGAFRDPKVFRWNNKWFMVVAGGPLRIYSSDNLRQWKVETVYSNIDTECPDLYPIQTDDGIKWVLSRGGRYYKVGDFKQVDGSWSFIPDKAYENKDGIMNFGKDSYAAMTYYIQDFGTETKPTLPELVEVNWMNNWDYCRDVATTVGQKFNGTYNLNLKLGLIKEENKYVLTQTPIDAYKNLRDTEHAMIFKDVDLSSNNNLLKDFKGDTYEIVAHFKPSETTTKVGFKVRVGDGQSTDIIYDLETDTLSIDRSKSGIQINNLFSLVNSQEVTTNEDGSIDLHLYIDKASVEVFSKGNTVAGTNQIFPDEDSLGASVLVEGGNVKADIAIYPLKSIWFEEENTTNGDDSADKSNTVGKETSKENTNSVDNSSQGEVNNNLTVTGKDNITNLSKDKNTTTLSTAKEKATESNKRANNLKEANTLPQMGETNSKAEVSTGIVALALSFFGLIFSSVRKRKQK